MLKTTLFTLVTITFSTLGYAADTSFMDLFKRGKNFISVAAATGGDAVATTTSGDDLKAGSGFTFHYGRDLRYSNRSKRFIRASIAYKYGFLSADNGTATVTAIPINVLYMQQNAKLVYGAGLTLHLQPTVKIPGASNSESLEIGLTGQLGYRLSETRTIGMVADFIDYDSFSANAIGISFTQRFGVK